MLNQTEIKNLGNLAEDLLKELIEGCDQCEAGGELTIPCEHHADLVAQLDLLWNSDVSDRLRLTMGLP